jgi:hypothetical protein
MLPQQYLCVYYYIIVSTDGLQWWHTHNLMLPQQYLWVYYYIRVSRDGLQWWHNAMKMKYERRASVDTLM